MLSGEEPPVFHCEEIRLGSIPTAPMGDSCLFQDLSKSIVIKLPGLAPSPRIWKSTTPPLLYLL